MIAHLKFEANERDAGQVLLKRARELAPADTSLWEKLLVLDVEEGNKDEALRTGLELVELYRVPGLHAKAREVLERLVETDPDSVDLRCELARSQVDAGDPKEAVKELTRLGKRFVGQERYRDARRLYKEILSIEPQNPEAAHCIECIDDATYERRRRRIRRFIRRSCTAVAVFVATLLLVIELSARLDYAEATRIVSQEEFIENRRYREAIDHFKSVVVRHPYTTTSLLEVRQRIKDLEAKLEDSAPPTPRD